MSRLPNAPLIEVIFELRWITSDQSDHYLHGDLYPLIKKIFPHREQLQGGMIFGNTPTHRFRTAPHDYPLIQIGPGILTVNTIDSKYVWSDYEKLIAETLDAFQEIYILRDSNKVRAVLQYIDLIKFDFEKGDVLSYLNDNLHVSINQEFYNSKRPSKNVGLALSFDDDLGSLNINFGRGKNLIGEDGIAIHTNLTSDILKPDMKVILEWSKKAHTMTSALFKEMTKGKLQELFASKN